MGRHKVEKADGNDICNTIFDYCDNYKTNPTQLSKKIGYDQSYLSKCLNGTYEISKTKWEEIKEKLKCAY